MPDLRTRLFTLALEAIALGELDRLAAPWLGGSGVVLTFHQVRAEPGARSPLNRLLEITPAFLDQVLTLLGERGYDLVALDEVPARLAAPGPRRFAALTFDDGYRDNLVEALPVLRRHRAPFTVFVCTGFADASVPLWWLDLEEAVHALPGLDLALPDSTFRHPGETIAQREAGLGALYWRLCGLSELDLRAIVARLSEQAGLDPLARTRRLCLDWDGLRALAAEPLVTFGAHSLSHARLARLDEAEARREIAESRARIAAELGRPIRHFAYPVGDAGSAGRREFALCRALGFESAFTTRPGVLFPAHAGHLHALPRLSVNGLYQQRRYVAALLSGLPTFAFNRGRRLRVT